MNPKVKTMREELGVTEWDRGFAIGWKAALEYLLAEIGGYLERGNQNKIQFATWLLRGLLSSWADCERYHRAG